MDNLLSSLKTETEFSKSRTLIFENFKEVLKGCRFLQSRLIIHLLAGITVFSAFCISSSAIAQDTSRTGIEVWKTKSGGVNVERLARLKEPWGMAYLPDGKLLITEKAGTLRIFSNGKLSAPVGGVPKVAYGGQGGLLDVAVDLDFAKNKFVYLTFTEAAEKQPVIDKDETDPRLGTFGDAKDVVLKGGALVRGRLEGNELKDMKVIWRQIPKTIGRGHTGGILVFAPDGKLFITSGDRQRFEPAQDLSSNLGKIIRINPNGSVPQDNPYVNKKGALPDIWSIGHRNPLGAAFNPVTKKLWIHEMGPLHGDELNIAEPGKNYGWPVVSNGDNYDRSRIPDHETRPEFAGPVEYWHPAISPAGMIFYTGNIFADWSGNILIGGLSSEVLIRLTLEGDKVKSEERIYLHRRIRDVIQAPDGSVVLLSDGPDGELLRLTPASK